MQLAKQKAFSSAADSNCNHSIRRHVVSCRAQSRQQLQEQHQQQQQSHTAAELLKRTGAAALSGVVAMSVLCAGETSQSHPASYSTSIAAVRMPAQHLQSRQSSM